MFILYEKFSTNNKSYRKKLHDACWQGKKKVKFARTAMRIVHTQLITKRTFVFAFFRYPILPFIGLRMHWLYEYHSCNDINSTNKNNNNDDDDDDDYEGTKILWNNYPQGTQRVYRDTWYMSRGISSI